MATKDSLPSSKSGKGAISEKLDALNARLRRQRAPSSAIRRSMEVALEEKSKKRRTAQSPATSGSSACKR